MFDFFKNVRVRRRRPGETEVAFTGWVDAIDGGAVRGWCLEVGNPSRSVALTVRHNGKDVARQFANRLREDLVEAGIGTGCHGFHIELPEHVSGDGLSVHVEQTGQALEHVRRPSEPKVAFTGCVDAVDGGAVRGWCLEVGNPSRSVALTVRHNGKDVARQFANRLREDLVEAGIGTGCHGFHIELPEHVSGDGLSVHVEQSGQVLEHGRSDDLRSAPITESSRFSQEFVCGQDFFSCLTLRICAYDRCPPTRIDFSLYEIGKSSRRLIIHKVEDCAAIVADHGHFDLFFEPQPSSAGKTYRLEIGSDAIDEKTSVAVNLDREQSRIAGHVVCEFASERHLDVGLSADVRFSPPRHHTRVPHQILYSPVTQCNLNCVHCISRHTRSSKKTISDELRQNIRDWCRKGWVTSIYTDYSGDILWAEERWGGELDFLIGLDVDFHIDTNGACLDERKSRRLFSSKLRSLNVSIDAAKSDTYEVVRKGSRPLPEIFDNVRMFNRIRVEENRSDVALSLGFTMMKSNIDQLEEFIVIGAGLGVDRIQCRHVEAYFDSMSEESLYYDKERFNDVRVKAIKLAKTLNVAIGIGPSFSSQASPRGHRFCDAPWSAAVITGSGDVQVCCLPKTKIGNLNVQSMEEIWEGERYAAFRKAVNSDKPPAVCQSCTYMRRYGNELSYVPVKAMQEWRDPIDWRDGEQADHPLV